MTQGLLSIVAFTALCMLSPGPDMALVMRNTLTRGRRSGFATSLGVLTGNLVHIAVAAFGLALLIAHSPVAYDALRYMGALYLGYLGLANLRSAARSTVPEQHLLESRVVAQRGYLEGIVNNLLNPKSPLFYLGVFTELITPESPRLHTVLMVGAMVLTSTVFWLLFVSTLELPRIRRLMARTRRTVDLGFGVTLIALALHVAFRE